MDFDKNIGYFGGFVCVAPKDFAQWFLHEKIKPFIVETDDGYSKYKVEIVEYVRKASKVNFQTINEMYVILPPGYTYNDEYTENAIAKHIAKAGLKLVNFYRHKHPLTAMPEPKCAIKFEYTTEYSAWLLKSLNKIRLGGDERKLKPGKKLAESLHLCTECLGSLDRMADVTVKCDCYSLLGRGSGAGSSSRHTSAASAFAARANKRAREDAMEDEDF